jgi:hypothetical protein
MDLSEAISLQRTVPKIDLWEYGNRKIECITGSFSPEGKARWECHSKNHILLIIYEKCTLYISKGETEFEAKYGEMMAVGEIQDGSVPSTSEIIKFFSFKVKDDQILEFFL